MEQHIGHIAAGIHKSGKQHINKQRMFGLK